MIDFEILEGIVELRLQKWNVTQIAIFTKEFLLILSPAKLSIRKDMLDSEIESFVDSIFVSHEKFALQKV